VSAEKNQEQLLRPGEHAPASGVYQVVHRGHRATHDVLIIRGEELPACRVCHADVRFAIGVAVPHYTHDWDLTGPSLELIQSPRTRRSESA